MIETNIDLRSLILNKSFTDKRHYDFAEIVCEIKDNLNLYSSTDNVSILKMVIPLLTSISATKQYIIFHSWHVIKISCVIARRLGMDNNAVKQLKVIALLHDVGKVFISSSILDKQGKLTEEEYDEIKIHPLLAYQILNGTKGMQSIPDSILQHHERYDGKGYPHGIKREKINKFASIVSVADAFDAMTGDRPYRESVSIEEAMEEIERCAGIQFDPEICRVLIGLMK